MFLSLTSTAIVGLFCVNPLDRREFLKTTGLMSEHARVVDLDLPDSRKLLLEFSGLREPRLASGRTWRVKIGSKFGPACGCGAAAIY
jgi:hypothetical protein